jgi:hypothetical protein
MEAGADLEAAIDVKTEAATDLSRITETEGLPQFVS